MEFHTINDYRRFQDGKQNHVSFPEFQQNGTAKQFSHGNYYTNGNKLFTTYTLFIINRLY